MVNGGDMARLRLALSGGKMGYIACYMLGDNLLLTLIKCTKKIKSEAGAFSLA